MRALIFAAAILGSASAFGGEYQAELGQCRFSLERDGVFRQSNLYTRNYLTPRCLTLGIADRFRDGPFGWRVAFVKTSFIETRGNVATLFDPDAFQSPLACQDAPGPSQGRGCLVTHEGHGQTWGFSFSGTVEQKVSFVSLIAEAGLFFFRHSYHSHPAHLDCSTCRRVRDYDESSGPFTDPSPLLGLTLKAGQVYFAARHYFPAEHRALSLTNHSFTQLSTGLVFKY